MTAPVGYIAYIDEAGDTGLRPIRTLSTPGASEWLVLSAVLVRAEKEQEVINWTKQIIADLDQHQVRQLHFRNLPDHKKESVVRKLASLDVRLFVLLHNKRRMIGYRNINAEKARVNKTAWFYAWCSKLLLESVTHYCGMRARKDHGEPRLLRCEFSQTGGVKIDDIRAYYKYIKEQALLGLSFKKEFPLDWSVLDHKELFSYPNAARYGLQLSDILASAFYSALEYNADGKVSPAFAKLLHPRICQDGQNRRFMYGVKLMPRSIRSSLPDDQRAIIDFYSEL